MRVVLLGAPGSGKGTQAVRLAQHVDLQHVSTGDILRDEVARQTDLGKKAKTFMDAGELVPDQLVVDMVASRLQKKFVLDGFPRSLPQAESLDAILKNENLPLDAVLNLVVPVEEIVKRLSSRLVCTACKAVFAAGTKGSCPKCGGVLGRRKDDNPETIRERLRVYKEKTQPLEAHYAAQNLLVNVDGMGAPDEIFSRLKSALETRGPA
ncbi:MAG: adenylate kinase [Candidatus Micrarchaeota archaeon]|nr:adenylate kinase [Candidatus Micrarchaeota archaeon]